MTFRIYGDKSAHERVVCLIPIQKIFRHIHLYGQMATTFRAGLNLGLDINIKMRKHKLFLFFNLISTMGITFFQ